MKVNEADIGSEMSDPFEGVEQDASEQAATEEPVVEAGDEGDAEAPKEEAPQPQKSAWVQKRIDELTRKRHEAEALVQETERKYKEELEQSRRQQDAMRALLEAQGKSASDIQPATKSYTREDIEAEARRIADERIATERAENQAREFAQKCNTVYDDGVKAYGDKFQAAVSNLNMAGVMSQGDTSFLEAALETENPAAVLAELGNNPDEAMRIAGLTPIRRALEMDRLARKVSAAPPPKPISQAPAPISPVLANTPKDDIDLYDEDADSAAWFAEWRRQRGFK